MNILSESFRLHQRCEVTWGFVTWVGSGDFEIHNFSVTQPVTSQG